MRFKDLPTQLPTSIDTLFIEPSIFHHAIQPIRKSPTRKNATISAENVAALREVIGEYHCVVAKGCEDDLASLAHKLRQFRQTSENDKSKHTAYNTLCSLPQLALKLDRISEVDSHLLQLISHCSDVIEDPQDSDIPRIVTFATALTYAQRKPGVHLLSQGTRTKRIAAQYHAAQAEFGLEKTRHPQIKIAYFNSAAHQWNVFPPNEREDFKFDAPRPLVSAVVKYLSKPDNL